MSHQLKKPSFWKVVLSTLAAAFGVQNRRNLEADFRHGNAYIYITAGVIFTFIFVVVVIVVVKIVLKNSGL